MSRDLLNFGASLRTQIKPKNSHKRAERLCCLYSMTLDTSYIERIFNLTFPYTLKLITNNKFRQGFTIEECISEFYVKLPSIMIMFAGRPAKYKGIFFVKYLEMRLRGHFSNIRIKEDRYMVVDNDITLEKFSLLSKHFC